MKELREKFKKEFNESPFYPIGAFKESYVEWLESKIESIQPQTTVTDEEILISKSHLGKCLEVFNGFIVIGQSQKDLDGKKRRISRGDTKGFFVMEELRNKLQQPQE